MLNVQELIKEWVVASSPKFVCSSFGSVKNLDSLETVVNWIAGETPPCAWSQVGYLLFLVVVINSFGYSSLLLWLLSVVLSYSWCWRLQWLRHCLFGVATHVTSPPPLYIVLQFYRTETDKDHIISSHQVSAMGTCNQPWGIGPSQSKSPVINVQFLRSLINQ